MKEIIREGRAVWAMLNILGVKVSIYRWLTSDEKVNFNAYAVIPNSQFLNSSAIGNPSYRKLDEIGVDTCYKWNEKQTEAEKLLYALHEIEKIIVKARAILKWDL